MAALMAILIAVLLDRGADYIPGGKAITLCRKVGWVDAYNNKIMELLARFNVTHNYVIALALFLPLWLVLILAKLIVVLALGTIGKVLFMAAVLFYLLGNNETQYESPFVGVHERSFGVLFWFAIFGTFGALLYWFLIVEQKNETISAVVTKVHAIAAWIPARITGFIYALVGEFSAAFKCWMGCMSNLTLPSSQVLVDCGRAAVDTAEPGDDTKLVMRAYIAWAVFSMILVLFL